MTSNLLCKFKFLCPDALGNNKAHRNTTTRRYRSSTRRRNSSHTASPFSRTLSTSNPPRRSSPSGLASTIFPTQPTRPTTSQFSTRTSSQPSSTSPSLPCTKRATRSSSLSTCHRLIVRRAIWREPTRCPTRRRSRGGTTVWRSTARRLPHRTLASRRCYMMRIHFSMGYWTMQLLTGSRIPPTSVLGTFTLMCWRTGRNTAALVRYLIISGSTRDICGFIYAIRQF